MGDGGFLLAGAGVGRIDGPTGQRVKGIFGTSTFGRHRGLAVKTENETARRCVE